MHICMPVLVFKFTLISLIFNLSVKGLRKPGIHDAALLIILLSLSLLFIIFIIVTGISLLSDVIIIVVVV